MNRDRALKSGVNICGCSKKLSGYTSDTDTINWLKKQVDPFYGFLHPVDRLVRYSWSTASNIINEIAFKNQL